MRVLALSSYPTEAAATRFRVTQFIEPLRERGVELVLSPFIDSKRFVGMYSRGGFFQKTASMMRPVASRISGLVTNGGFDILFIQREAMMFGPPIFERLYSAVRGIPMVVDLDDATYLPYVSPTYGRLGSMFKFFGKTDELIRRASIVTCGNRFIAEYVKDKGGKAVVIPTLVDLDKFKPAMEPKEHEVPSVGWIGTHSTFPFVRTIFPVLERLAGKHAFRLKLIGAGNENVSLGAVDVENLAWSMDREPDDFASLDIGLYPITTSASAGEQWINSKSGFKAIQYLSVGVPFVMSPVGICAEIGIPGKTHLNAKTEQDWYDSLDRLLSDRSLRMEMGRAGREYALENYQIEHQADVLASVFREATVGRTRSVTP